MLAYPVEFDGVLGYCQEGSRLVTHAPLGAVITILSTRFNPNLGVHLSAKTDPGADLLGGGSPLWVPYVVQTLDSPPTEVTLQEQYEYLNKVFHG